MMYTYVASSNFFATFDTPYNTYFPMTSKKFVKSLNPLEPWMSRGILISRKWKNKLSKTSLKNPSAENIFQFKKFRNLYNLVIRNAKKHYYEKQLEENKQNLCKTWKIPFSSINKNIAN